jgi:hypothetical protein
VDLQIRNADPRQSLEFKELPVFISKMQAQLLTAVPDKIGLCQSRVQHLCLCSVPLAIGAVHTQHRSQMIFDEIEA